MRHLASVALWALTAFGIILVAASAGILLLSWSAVARDRRAAFKGRRAGGAHPHLAAVVALVRDRLRLATTIGLVHGTTSQQMRAILADLEAILRRQPKLWPDAVSVCFKELAASSLDVEIVAWFQTADLAEFQAIRQDVLLEILAAVECHGSALAFPTRTVHVATPAPADPRRL
jgi:hypothetical protein